MGNNPTVKTLVIGGNPGRWSASNPDPAHLGSNGVEAFVFALNGDYTGSVPSADEASNYDCVIANLNREHIDQYCELASKKRSNLKLVALIEGGAEEYLEFNAKLHQVFDLSDLVAVINEKTLPFFAGMTSTPVRTIGIPYPIEMISRLAKPITERVDECLICPRKGQLPSILASKSVPDLKPRMYAPKFHRKLSTLPYRIKTGDWGYGRYRDLWLKQVPELAVRFEMELLDFLKDAADCRLWINLDPRYTWARYNLDAAALSVPIITTESTGHGMDLWPYTTVSSAFDLDKARAIARRIVDDPQFAERAVTHAQSRLEEYSFGACVGRLMAELS